MAPVPAQTAAAEETAPRRARAAKASGISGAKLCRCHATGTARRTVGRLGGAAQTSRGQRHPASPGVQQAQAPDWMRWPASLPGFPTDLGAVRRGSRGFMGRIANWQTDAQETRAATSWQATENLREGRRLVSRRRCLHQARLVRARAGYNALGDRLPSAAGPQVGMSCAPRSGREVHGSRHTRL